MLRHWVACGRDGDCLGVIAGCGVGGLLLLLLWILVAGGGWAWFFWQWRCGGFGGGGGDKNLFPHVDDAQFISGGTISAKANLSSA